MRGDVLVGKGVDTPEDIKRKCAERKANRQPVGRPKGGNMAIKTFNEIVENGGLQQAMDALVKTASDPDHKAFAASQKLLMDRALHLSNFEKKGSGSSAPIVNIQIGSTDKEVSIDGEVID